MKRCLGALALVIGLVGGLATPASAAVSDPNPNDYLVHFYPVPTHLIIESSHSAMDSYLQEVVRDWNGTGTRLTLEFRANRSADCDGIHSGPTVPVCFKHLTGAAGIAHWCIRNGNEACGGVVFVDPDFRTSQNVYCHEVGHILGFTHPADGSAGPCYNGNVQTRERDALQQFYGFRGCWNDCRTNTTIYR